MTKKLLFLVLLVSSCGVLEAPEHTSLIAACVKPEKQELVFISSCDNPAAGICHNSSGEVFLHDCLLDNGVGVPPIHCVDSCQ